MKRFFLAIAAMAAFVVQMNAGGYQINLLSAKQNGMGQTGTALKLGSESMIFNPAGMAFMNDKVNFSGSLAALSTSYTATYSTTNDKYKTDNPVIMPFAVNLGYSITDNLKAGVSFYTPSGANTKWDDAWEGAIVNQSFKLSAYTIQPTIAWRITPKLSVGAGMNITWGSMRLAKGEVSYEVISMILMYKGYDQTVIHQFNSATMPIAFRYNAVSDASFGFNVGAMYDINNQWTIGASYRSKVNLKLNDGITTVVYMNELAREAIKETFPLYEGVKFSTEMPCVSVLSVGGSYKHDDRLTVAADVRLSFWKQYKKLDIEYTSGELDGYNRVIYKNYRNSWTFNVGGEYKLSNSVDLRAGVTFNTSPVRKDFCNPELPDMSKIEPSVGFSYRPIKNLSIDASVIYIGGLTRKGASVGYSKYGYSANCKFPADYTLSGWCPSFGVSLAF